MSIFFYETALTINNLNDIQMEKTEENNHFKWKLHPVSVITHYHFVFTFLVIISLKNKCISLNTNHSTERFSDYLCIFKFIWFCVSFSQHENTADEVDNANKWIYSLRVKNQFINVNNFYDINVPANIWIETIQVSFSWLFSAFFKNHIANLGFFFILCGSCACWITLNSKSV